MAIFAWPTFPGLGPDISRERLDKRVVFESAGGTEVVTVLSLPRFRYSLRIALSSTRYAASPWASYTETGLVEYLIGQSQQGAIQLTFVDPIDGTTRYVRIDPDATRMDQQGNSTWWACEITLITQL